MIVALEGPCLSGKTTVAKEVVRRLAPRRPLSFSCYAADLSTELPHPVAASAAEQLVSTRLFLDVETKRFDRAAEAEATFVLLDRSVDTLAAHALAVERHLDVADRYFDTLAMIGREPKMLVPDLTFFLVVPYAELLRRVPSFPRLPPVYYEHRFLGGFREHFENGRRFARRLIFLDAADDPSVSAAQLVDEIDIHSP